MFDQIIYTSCKTGINYRNSGFQIYSYSENLSSDEVNELEQIIANYRPPEALSNNQENPVSYSFHTLNSGKLFVGQSSYIGNDYMGDGGREGNFISHFYIYNSDNIFYPLELFYSASFKQELSFEEANSDDKPSYLQQVESLSQGIISIDSVCDFISSGREIVFINMIAAVVYHIQNKDKSYKQIIVLDTKENIPFWIAALHYIFPIYMVNELPFTTYTYSPMHTKYLICGVEKNGTEFNYNSNNNQDHYYIFDVESQIYPEFDTTHSFYEMIGLGMTVSYEIIKDFHSFLYQFKNQNISSDILDAHTLYELLTHTKEISENHMNSAIDFATKYANAETHNEIIKLLLNNKEQILSCFDINLLYLLIKYILSSLNDISDIVLEDNTYLFIIDSMYSQLVDNENADIDIAIDIYKYSCQISNGHFNKYIFSEKAINYICDLLSENDILAINKYLFMIYAGYFSNGGHSDKIAYSIISTCSTMIDENIKSFIKSILIKNENNIFILPYIIKLLNQVTDSDVCKWIWKQYKDVLFCKKQYVKNNDYDYLIENEYYDLAINLFKSEIVYSSHSDKTVIEFIKYTAQNNKAFFDENTELLLCMLIDEKKHIIENEHQWINEANSLISTIKSLHISQNISSKILQYYFEWFPLHTPTREILKLYKVITQEYNVSNTYIDLFELGCFITKNAETTNKLFNKLSEYNDSSFDGIKDNMYEDYLYWILPIIVDVVENPNDFIACIEVFNIPSYNEKIYANILVNIIEKCYRQQKDYYVLFLTASYCRNIKNHISNVLDDFLFNILYKFNDKKLMDFETEYYNRIRNNKSLDQYIKNLIIDVKEMKSKTIIGRMKNALNKKRGDKNENQ